MPKRKWIWILSLTFIVIMLFMFFTINFEYAYLPPESKVINSDHLDEDSTSMFQSQRFGINQTSLLNHDPITINEEMLQLGRQVLYEETFGNEIYFTDIMGILNGPMNLTTVTKAILKLNGKGTTNLQIEIPKDIKIGGKQFIKGEKVDTGLDVPQGAFIPLGTKVSLSDGKARMGVTCMACHATVSETGLVMEGVPNSDLNLGLLMAMASNSASYFTHTDVSDIKNYLQSLDENITTTALPDPVALEEAVDKVFMKWPRGSFDTTVDLEANPTQIPDAFTFQDFPYGWNGFAAIGPFKGLSAFSSNVNSQNTDPLSTIELTEELYGVDKELYIGTILQNAANADYRYDQKSGLNPSEFLGALDLTPENPGFNELVKVPSFPKVNFFAPTGLFSSSPGFKVGEQVYAMSAYQNTIKPPKDTKVVDLATLEKGEEIFRNQCLSCHSGAGYTNHQIIALEQIKTEPSRAQAFSKTKGVLGSAMMYSPDTPVPIPEDARILPVNRNRMSEDDLKLAFAYGNSGGYKVKGLIGLRWTAPYLHDGGVAVGTIKEKEIGITGTLSKGILPDPHNSLLALIDRNLRTAVIEANATSDLKDVHVTGEGHEFWVDNKAGFSQEDQEALIEYLLSLEIEKRK